MVMRSVQEQPTGRVRPDASKNGQISPVGRRSGCEDYGQSSVLPGGLLKRGISPMIHPGLGFIWGIPVKV
jgi:hypothetical protein